jgi:L-asparaginase II
VSRWTDVPVPKIIRAVDGCGVVVFGLPLEAMARAYARLAVAAARGDEIPSRITRAITTRPFVFGGSDRFDSLVVEETNGRVISKVGAEGVHSVALFDLGLGFAIKVEDGATRAQYPAVLRMLELLGALPENISPKLAEYGRARIRNTRGEVVGELLPASA